MTSAAAEKLELYLRFTRRSMVALLGVILALGGVGLSLALWPEGAVSRWTARAGWAIPVAIAALAAILRASLRGDHVGPRSPEAKAVLEDEWRRSAMERARRVAFAGVLAAQLPLGLLLRDTPARRAVPAMAVATVTIGLALLAALFLLFDRDEPDA